MGKDVAALSLSVLVTRPEQQALSLADTLRTQGMSPVLMPTLEIVPRILSPQENESIASLDLYSHVICVSANAARFGLECIADFWPQWPVQQQWIAVGPATYNAMQNWGLGEIQFPKGASHSEGVLALDSLQDLNEHKVLILRGVSGRELMANTLRERGAVVDYLELYERKKPAVDPNILGQWLCSSSKKAIVVTSGDGLKNLISMVKTASVATGESGIESALYKIPVLVVSQRLAEFAQQKGFEDVWLAENPSDHAIASCLEQHITD
ncbi:hypothetical protein A9Q99_14230 [Gammaproteobacteria bacterium 45_16_T64]|nr:hypothetical protein A9Q99_14230 [Gammaproteobacteria bacterium 45_16_T64]